MYNKVDKAVYNNMVKLYNMSYSLYNYERDPKKKDEDHKKAYLSCRVAFYTIDIDNKTIQENLWYDTSIISRKFRHLKEIWLITHFWKTKQYIPLYENRIIFMDIYHNLINAGFNSWSILDEPEWLSEVLPK